MRRWIISLSIATSVFCCTHANPVERAYEFQRLGQRKDAGAVAELAKAMNDAEVNVAYAAAQALAEIGDASAADALIAAVKAGKGEAAGDAALMCAEARGVAGDENKARALYESCYVSQGKELKWAAFGKLAGMYPKEYVSAVKAELVSSDKISSAAAVDAVKANAALVPAAIEAAKGTEGRFKARIVSALAQYSSQPDVIALMKAALKDDEELVRVVSLRAVVASGDNGYIEDIFSACLDEGKVARSTAVTLAASFSAPGMDDFLYGKMKVPESCALAIDLLAERHEKRLVSTLCDASLYSDMNTAKVAAKALRTALRKEDFDKALNFVCPDLAAEYRSVFVSALSSVAQQLPDKAFVQGVVSSRFGKLDIDGRKSLLPLYATMQSPEVCVALAAELKSPDVSYRKDIVRSLSRWSRPEAMDVLVKCSVADADSSVKILALRNALILMNKEGMADNARKLSILKTLATIAERDAERRMIFSDVKRLPGDDAKALREELAAQFGIEDNEKRVVAINVGGPAIGEFIADAFFDEGRTYAAKIAIDLTETSGTAPEAVYQSSRYQNCAYSLAGFEQKGKYILRLHYAELFHNKAGGRAGSVVVNGTKIIDNQPSRDKGKGFTVEHVISADDKGRVKIEFKTTKDQVKVNGIEIVAEGAAAKKEYKVAGVKSVAAVVAIPKPVKGKINVMVLSGANNHNWKESTAALQEVFAADKRFAVAVVESPWDMKPADIEGFDLLFSNWNTLNDKREWSKEMKDGFIAWVKEGGGFFVLHAGASLFYGWEDFHKLAGGTWEKETFHPHQQEFTVKIADKNHPVTKGMQDFKTFDEPWQRLSNRNPQRQVLATAIITKENKGTGEAEPFAFTTTMEKGRCFNLVLGHNGKAIKNAGCQALILRGSEWAATGVVK